MPGSIDSAPIFQELNKTDFAVIEALQSHAPNIQPSQGRIAALTGKSIATVKRSIRKLKDRSLLLVTRPEQTSKPNIYELQLQSIATAAAALTGFALVGIGMLPPAMAALAPAPKIAKAPPAKPVKIVTNTAFAMPAKPRLEPVQMECPGLTIAPKVISSTCFPKKITAEMIPADLQPAATQIVDFWNNNRIGKNSELAFNTQIRELRKILEVSQMPGLIVQIDKAIFAGQMGKPWMAINFDNYKKYGMNKPTDRNLTSDQRAQAQQECNRANGLHNKDLAPCGRLKTVVKEEAKKAARQTLVDLYHEELALMKEAEDQGVEYIPSDDLRARSKAANEAEDKADKLFPFG